MRWAIIDYLAVFVFFGYSLLYFKKGIDGIFNKKMNMFKWFAFSRTIKSFINSDPEKVITGTKARIIGIIYVLIAILLIMVVISAVLSR